MKVLVTGAQGQVGRAVIAAAAASVRVEGVAHAELDVTERDAVRRRVLQSLPDVVVNSAGYTAVDRAESEPELAYRINEDGARNLASAAAEAGARLIHLSTDFVFDGARSSPYRPSDAPHPVSVYGASKLAGENAVREVLADGAVVLRTAWVYAARGQNFVNTMLRLMRERGTVRVVGDQIGTPTAAHSLAAAIWRLIERPAIGGVLHWTDLGVASWYDFAVAIAEEGAARGLVPTTVTVTQIASDEYPTPARRPAYSVLDKRDTIGALGMAPAPWRHNLRGVLEEIAVA